MIRASPSRVRFQGCTTMGSRYLNWQQKTIQACRWRGTCVWSGTRCPCWPLTPPPPRHWQCPICLPQSWKPPPLWLPPPPAGSGHQAWGKASQRSEAVWKNVWRKNIYRQLGVNWVLWSPICPISFKVKGMGLYNDSVTEGSKHNSIELPIKACKLFSIK